MGIPHKITITTDGHGHFTYSPSTLHVKVGDTVGWTSGKGPFAVSFMNKTPFKRVSLSSRESEEGEHMIEAVRIREHAIGHHHYAVAVGLPGPPKKPGGAPTTHIVLDSGCPDIVVSDDDN